MLLMKTFMYSLDKKVQSHCLSEDIDFLLLLEYIFLRWGYLSI